MRNNTPTRFVFWQNMLAIHQSAHLRALADRPGLSVTLVVDQEIEPERKALGWPVPDFGKTQVIVSPEKGEIERLVREDPEGSVHVFTGIHRYPASMAAFRMSLSVPATRGIYSEPKDHRGVKAIARRLASSRERWLYDRFIRFILPTGMLGARWFLRAGYPADKIFPYGYWVERPNVDQTDLARGEEDGPVRLIYAGQLVPRKGVDILVQALTRLPDARWRLTILGSGPLEGALRGVAARAGIASRIGFLAPMANDRAVRTIAEHDLLILPSRFDGWGAVVNEALMAGVPVLCSDACGAADLVREPWRGEAFPAGSPIGLAEPLARWVGAGRATRQARERIRDWSACIGGEATADYLLAVVEASAGRAPRPAPPWQKASSLAELAASAR